MKTRCGTASLILGLVLLLSLIGVSPVGADKTSSAGTSLAATKTLDICSLYNGTWRYSGVISVGNEGAVDTIGLNISDHVEYMAANEWVEGYEIPISYSGEIPAGTAQSLTFPYRLFAAALPGTIRNNASITILNHSGHLGQPFGPNPKASWTGEVQACYQSDCVHRKPYWAGPSSVWPDPYSRDATFFLSGQTWEQVVTKPPRFDGYLILADQYIAAVLNQANGAAVPRRVQTILNRSFNWLSTHGADACPGRLSCVLQKIGAMILLSYNKGAYRGGPHACVAPSQ